MIRKTSLPPKADIKAFLGMIEFTFPVEFIDFLSETNGAEIITDTSCVIIWALTDMVYLNNEYSVDKYAAEFFLIGSDGGDLAYAVEKSTGYIFDIPFVGMSREEARFRSKTFDEFIDSLQV